MSRREVERARETCLRLLGYRARSRGELHDRLRRKGFAEDVVAATLEELERAGLVDDQGFARAWVQERLAGNPRGSRGLRWELRAKGVAEELIQQAIAEELGGERELEAALRAAARYAVRPDEDESSYLRRLSGALKRRGFAFDVIAAALACLREGQGSS